MNLVFLQRLYPVYGGGETVTICLANEMTRRGWNVHILYFKYNRKETLPYISPQINAIKIDNINCDEFSSDNNDAKKASEFLRQFISHYNIDIVINQWWNAEYIKGIKGYNGVRVIKCLHQAFIPDNTYYVGIRGFLKKHLPLLYHKYLIRNSIRYVNSFLPLVDKFVFLSSSFLEQYLTLSKYQDRNNLLEAIPNPSVFRDTISRSEFNEKENFVLVVARMEESQKRLSMVLKVWNIIEKVYGVSDWKLLMIGEGRSLPEYIKMSKDYNLQNVKFLGYQDPLMYYKKAKIFLMTSSFEGFGMTLIEAMQNGVVPIVMNSYLSLKDIIKNKENGIIIPNGDVAKFAEQLYTLICDKKYREKIAFDGMHSWTRFSVVNIVNQWEKLIESMK